MPVKKVQELTHGLKHYRWHILGLSEVRWTGFRRNYHGWETRSDTAEKTRNISIGWNSLYGKKL